MERIGKNMGFFDREIRDSLDEFFDYDGDGVLDAGEQAMEFEYLDRLDRENENTDDYDSSWNSDYDELEDAGLDYDELECMDEDECRETLEDAGLDPDDFDF